MAVCVCGWINIIIMLAWAWVFVCAGSTISIAKVNITYQPPSAYISGGDKPSLSLCSEHSEITQADISHLLGGEKLGLFILQV